MQEKYKGTLSIIILSYFSGDRISKAYYRLKELFSKEGIPFELIIVDDGSTDGTFDKNNALAAKEENIVSRQLSRNYTSHYSAFAGLSIASGDCCTMISDDEQEPYELLVQMYHLWQKGHKVIIPYRDSRTDPFISKTFAGSFYKLFNYISEVKYPYGGADTWFIDRELVDIINDKIRPKQTTTITEILRLGFSPVYIPYERQKSINKKSRWTMKKKIKLAKDLIFSSSSWPIHTITNLGLTLSLLSFLLVLFFVYIRFFGNDKFWHVRNFPGWTSTVVIISFFSGLILLSLGVIAEYIWRIFEEVKDRPGYIIKKAVTNKHKGSTPNTTIENDDNK